jgi:prepilin-type N-terminal cleavage/methylation domain-containing protein
MHHTEASCRNPRMRGFTVIELLVATVVLLVGIVGVSQMVTQAVDSDLRNRDTSSSMMAAQRELEQMLRLPIDANQLGTPTDYSFTDTDGDAAYVGSLPVPATGTATAAPPGPSQTGCPLAVNGDIDFTAACAVAGYVKVLAPALGPAIEIRWNVVTFYGNDNGTIRPVLKKIAIAGRSNDGTLNVPQTMNVMVAP